MKQKKDPVIVKHPPPPNIPSNHPNRKSLKPYICIIPEPINPFQAPYDLIHRNFVERSVLSLEFALKSVEYSLSPHGQLRAWLKFWCFLVLYGCITIVLVTPLIAFLLHEFTGISTYLLLTSQDVFYSIFYLSGGSIILLALLAFIRKILKHLLIQLFK